MDIFRRQKFNEAMFAKNRTLAIRVGNYQSSDIKEASFDYGYIKGDTYKPGGTCAGSGKIMFTRIITTFNKLDRIYPEIGLLVDGAYEWVKMGEYFINDIEIDRNRKTTKLDLMDGMFKLNREHVTDLTYPAEIRHVIKEICLKTGITLANEYMDIASMNYRIDQIPKNKKMTFRDILSLASQMLGMSCFFNREGKLEIKELTDSGITITADSYFMHGLTKSEIQYQIAGISCKKDKETLTVGLRTGRSLELDNLFMTQSILDNLYHKIKDIRYYPFNLNYQGHLLLNVGEWVTIKTNTGETFKSPILSQSFTFKGGLRGRISADSKAGNDAQYSYAGSITKKIVQFNEFEKQIQNQIEEADKGFDQKVAKIKKDFNEQFELAKAKAEEVKQDISSEIDKKFQSFDNAAINEARRKAEEALRQSSANASLAQEAKNISERAKTQLDNLKSSSQTVIEQIESFKTQYGTKLNEVKSTADGLFTKMGAVETYISKDGQRQESLQRYARDESARQVSAVREQISRDYVGKSAYQEDVRGLERRFSAISTQTNNDMATKISQYKQTVDGRFANLTSQIAGKTNQTDFQRVRETSQLYERIIGSNENDISNKVARMALTSQLFQVEVSKNEVLKTVQRQIAGSWSVRNINSAGDLISGINLGANGQNRIAGKLTHITGETLIDKAVIKSAMVDKLKTANFEAGSVTTTILDAEAVTADKLRVDQALFNKLVANEAYLSLLFAKQAFINRVRSISIDASQITTGTLSGDRIYGGTISGTTLTGHTRINIGEYGSLDTVNGGLQINVPSAINSKDGLGVQFIGSYGRGENVPYGLFVYRDDDITRGGTALDTDEFVMTVRGYINTKGIGWLKTGKGKVGSVTTGKLGFWQSTVALDYAPNDIYYTYNGTAYGLWAIIKQTFSDSRLKENIVDCKHKALDYIQQFQFKEYDWKKQDDRPRQAHTKIGLIAQEVQAVDPTLVYENGDTLNLDNLRLTTMALKAIQELNQRLEKLEKIA
ncbi:tail fiber domain-containing protein [Streptococcus mitis]|uniref:Tail fiber domain-containing protein n=1 Tax=Streptococcus mitis TaxID=28037 RepID=A0A6I1TTS3_STRMT|nr:tail fiber domain-containing protein [Streptococcus mitis]MQQ29312.1 tail fiber domain-containing protein [Streptococcus mitis]DAP48096.1 MAG TPA: Neck appendage protein [Caudoviricetes sp.]